ncbi:related to ubiquitin-like protein modifier [Armillaria ostoyae]|uniref:Related to ubiquitin-like protein modifier n=1 Tax=Armillaria ostoyae TaxID=47428 RepID=A0A284S486_ARMOS|nr:related to ubiquitin-like protein modifier [Armillaria ostoyae]
MSDEELQGGPSQDEIKGENNDPNAPINVKVVTSSGEEVFFKIKRSTKLSKLQGAYASKVGKDVATIRFLYDGNRIQEDDTPQSLEMEDNDTIDVMVEPDLSYGVWTAHKDAELRFRRLRPYKSYFKKMHEIFTNQSTDFRYPNQQIYTPHGSRRSG